MSQFINKRGPFLDKAALREAENRVTGKLNRIVGFWGWGGTFEMANRVSFWRAGVVWGLANNSIVIMQEEGLVDRATCRYVSTCLVYTSTQPQNLCFTSGCEGSSLGLRDQHVLMLPLTTSQSPTWTYLINVPNPFPSDRPSLLHHNESHIPGLVQSCLPSELACRKFHTTTES